MSPAQKLILVAVGISLMTYFISLLLSFLLRIIAFRMDGSSWFVTGKTKYINPFKQNQFELSQISKPSAGKVLKVAQFFSWLSLAAIIFIIGAFVISAFVAE